MILAKFYQNHRLVGVMTSLNEKKKNKTLKQHAFGRYVFQNYEFPVYPLFAEVTFQNKHSEKEDFRIATCFFYLQQFSEDKTARSYCSSFSDLIRVFYLHEQGCRSVFDMGG